MLNQKSKKKNQSKKLQSFDLFKNETDIKTTDIFEISSPFEQALPNMIKENFPFDILNLFDTKGTPHSTFQTNILILTLKY
ncbi:hypothetical protein [Streptococcus thermophilus]|uniref:hypothetical protein n=1 Tax=Streptococcus thermophilus TaxID=1308 RepID=UPI00321982AC